MKNNSADDALIGAVSQPSTVKEMTIAGKQTNLTDIFVRLSRINKERISKVPPGMP